MSKKEALKVELEILKAILLLFIGSLFTAVGYAFINYAMIGFYRFIVGVWIVWFLLCGVYVFAMRIKYKLNELEEL